MEVRLHPHALGRLQERGATEEEVRATVEQGEPFPGKFGALAFDGTSDLTASGVEIIIVPGKSKLMLCKKVDTGW